MRRKNTPAIMMASANDRNVKPQCPSQVCSWQFLSLHSQLQWKNLWCQNPIDGPKSYGERQHMHKLLKLQGLLQIQGFVALLLWLEDLSWILAHAGKQSQQQVWRERLSSELHLWREAVTSWYSQARWLQPRWIVFENPTATIAPRTPDFPEIPAWLNTTGL